MKRLILNVAVCPPNYDKVCYPGATIELPDDLAAAYVQAGYAGYDDGTYVRKYGVASMQETEEMKRMKPVEEQPQPLVYVLPANVHHVEDPAPKKAKRRKKESPNVNG